MNDPILETITLMAPAETVWQALTDKSKMKRWYFDIPDFEPAVGAVFNFYEPGEQRKFHHRCTLLELVPNSRLQHTWTYPDITQGVSVVTWDLRQDGDTTIVTLTHAGIESFADGGKDFVRESFEAGWKEILGTCLKDFVE